ncbi:MAG: hypothetical protein E6772_16530 [Dysgonomonas sp.]|nr:hypothetical protein [Dysgonomonas sp.]
MKTTKKYILSATLLLFTATTFAQVTIGSDNAPEKAALLELKTKGETKGSVSSERGGLLLPRVEIRNVGELGVFSKVTGLDNAEERLKHTGLAVYNIGTTNTNGSVLVGKGIYVWNGSRWMEMGEATPGKFFYMPSIEIPLESSEIKPIDLYSKYAAQFTTPLHRSAGSPASIPSYNRDELYYYITDIGKDSNGDHIINVQSITADGWLNYTGPATPDESLMNSYINIVFVVK